MSTYTRTKIIGARLIGGGTTDLDRCQYENPTTLGQCIRVAGHGTDNGGRPSYERLVDGHIIRWGRDPE